MGSTMQHVLATKSKGSDIRSVRRIDARALGSCGGGVKITVASRRCSSVSGIKTPTTGFDVPPPN